MIGTFCIIETQYGHEVLLKLPHYHIKFSNSSALDLAFNVHNTLEPPGVKEKKVWLQMYSIISRISYEPV